MIRVFTDYCRPVRCSFIIEIRPVSFSNNWNYCSVLCVVHTRKNRIRFKIGIISCIYFVIFKMVKNVRSRILIAVAGLKFLLFIQTQLQKRTPDAYVDDDRDSYINARRNTHSEVLESKDETLHYSQLCVCHYLRESLSSDCQNTWHSCIGYPCKQLLGIHCLMYIILQILSQCCCLSINQSSYNNCLLTTELIKKVWLVSHIKNNIVSAFISVYILF